MEQYLNLVWKNYTASLSQNSDENFLDENTDASDLYVDTDLHYKIPFWIGVFVISILFCSAILAGIRYCIYTLCSSHDETEKMVLMPPKSPCISPNITNTTHRQRQQTSKSISFHSSTHNETLSPSLERSRNVHIPIIRQYSRSQLTSHHRNIPTDDMNNHYFSPNQVTASKIHDIYVLPVSPTLSSSSSRTTTNTDENNKSNSNTMPRQSSSSINHHTNSISYGIKNDCFTDSPQPINRTLPRSYNGLSRHIQPPSQPPPLPPTISQINIHNQSSSSSVFQHQLSPVDLNPDAITFSYNSNQEKPLPPPRPCRREKSCKLPIGFEDLTKQSDKIQSQTSPQNEYLDHPWPNPPESMTTSQISGPISIPYDHLIPTIITHQNTSTNLFQQYRLDEHSMLTESET